MGHDKFHFSVDDVLSSLIEVSESFLIQFRDGYALTSDWSFVTNESQ